MSKRWSQARAKHWYDEQPWLIGCNFIPSTAINQLEMWQADTFDLATIDRELGWAAGLGFNTVRVYLHDLLWLADADGLLERINQYLTVASKHGIRTTLVFFDACWNNYGYLGKQPQPIPGVHNSGWLQSPTGKVLVDGSAWGRLEAYVVGVMDYLRDDERVLMWDLYNEPGNEGYLESSFPLLQAVFAWARRVNPAQPLTVGVWDEGSAFERLNQFQLEHSDIITFHNYEPLESLERQMTALQSYDRPLICTEYMARTRGSYFATHVPVFKDARVGCYNWGLVAGKTQTQYPWYSSQGRPEPELWYHDIFYSDGTPYDETEVNVIKATTAPDVVHR